METQYSSNNNNDTIESWVRISLAEIPPGRLRPLLEAFEFHPHDLLTAGPTAWSGILAPKQSERLDEWRKQDIRIELDALEKAGGHIVTLRDPEYPINLRQISDASPILFVRGELLPDDRFSIAIVGSRRATSYGLSIAERFAAELTGKGLCIVSGGARGIDTRAHRGALAGGGRTVAFVACGLDVIYPAENRSLFARIAEKGSGAVVTEFAPGITPEPWRFPARNRLISGMSLGTLVVESPTDSGALITATDAAAQGREVFAVPGPIETGRSSGCHKLIQEGAKLVESARDIIDELGLLTLESDDCSGETRFSPPPSNLPNEQREVLEMLTLQPRLVDSMIADSPLTSAQVVAVLTLLEMRGLARRVPGNAFVRVL